jgi:hypothetical protein
MVSFAVLSALIVTATKSINYLLKSLLEQVPLLEPFHGKKIDLFLQYGFV